MLRIVLATGELVVRGVNLTRQELLVRQASDREWETLPKICVRWPNLTLPRHNRSWGIGADGSIVTKARSYSADEMREKILEKGRDHLPPGFTGYLAINNNAWFMVTNGYMGAILHGNQVTVQQIAKAPVTRQIDFRGGIHNTILWRPYPLDQCWLGANNEVVSTIEWVVKFLQKKKDALVDPLTWDGKDEITLKEDT